MAITSRRKPAASAPDVEELRAGLARLRDDLDMLRGDLERERRDTAVRDRILAKLAARLAPGHWTEFKQLLTGQYSVSFTDAETFLEILTGRRP